MLGLRLVTGSGEGALALQPEYNVSRSIENGDDTFVHSFALSVSLAPLPEFDEPAGEATR